MGKWASLQAPRLYRGGVKLNVKLLSEDLGLTSREEWLEVAGSVDSILQQRNLIGKTPSSIANNEEVLTAMAEQLEEDMPKVSSRVQGLDARRNIIKSTILYRMTHLRQNMQRRDARARKSLAMDSRKAASAVEMDEDEDEERFFSIEELVITLLVPSVPSFRVQFIPSQIPDNQFSVERLFEIIAEKGLKCKPENHIIRNETGKQLSSWMDLRVALQMLVKEENPTPSWLVLTKAEDRIYPRPRSYIPGPTMPTSVPGSPKGGGRFRHYQAYRTHLSQISGSDIGG